MLVVSGLKFTARKGVDSPPSCPPSPSQWPPCRTRRTWPLKTTKERGGFRRLPGCSVFQHLAGGSIYVFCQHPRSIGSLKTPRETYGYCTGLVLKSSIGSPDGSAKLP